MEIQIGIDIFTTWQEGVWSQWSAMSALVVLALVIDALVGGPRLLGRLPGYDSLLRLGIGNLERTTNAARYNWPAGLFFGSLLLLLGVGASAALGFWLSSLPYDGWGFWLKVALLVLLLGQRAVIDSSRMMLGDIESITVRDENQYYEAHSWLLERMLHRMVDGLIANIIVFLLFGFVGLLIYRFLSVWVSIAVDGGCQISYRPFHRPLMLVTWPFSFVLGLAASFFILLSGVIIAPHRLGWAFALLGQRGFWSCLPLRYFTYGITTRLLDIVLKASKGAADQPLAWIGPSEGRARITRDKVILMMMLQIVAWLQIIGLLSLSLLTSQP